MKKSKISVLTASSRYLQTAALKHQIQESAAAKAYDAEWKWMNSSEAKQRSAAAKALALSDFQKRFPHAQMARFQVQVEFDANRKALGGGGGGGVIPKW